jgi:NADPH:quinone reductase-like Zn-dependent oxidoreductase
METVGAATWSHSINSLKPGGTCVISGATLRGRPGQGRADQDLLQAAAGRRVHDGHRAELERLANFVVNQGSAGGRPDVPAGRRPSGFEKMAAGDVFGKVVFTL